jgi:hypothetical protein
MAVSSIDDAKARLKRYADGEEFYPVWAQEDGSSSVAALRRDINIVLDELEKKP